jgi:hypothetical protein
MVTDEAWAAAAARGEWQLESEAGGLWVRWQGEWRVTAGPTGTGRWIEWNVDAPPGAGEDGATGFVESGAVDDESQIELAKRIADGVLRALQDAAAPRLSDEQAAAVLGLDDAAERARPHGGGRDPAREETEHPPGRGDVRGLAAGVA